MDGVTITLTPVHWIIAAIIFLIVIVYAPKTENGKLMSISLMNIFAVPVILGILYAYYLGFTGNTSILLGAIGVSAVFALVLTMVRS